MKEMCLKTPLSNKLFFIYYFIFYMATILPFLSDKQPWFLKDKLSKIQKSIVKG